MKKFSLLCALLLTWACVGSASAGVLWEEDFQSFTAAENTGSPIVPQDGTWALTESGSYDYHANVADQTYDNGLGWPVPGWSYFGDLPVGEKVLAVQGHQSGGPDGIVTATKTLPALGATQTTLTASATIATIFGTQRQYTAELLVSNASGDNIVTMFFNVLSQPGASVYLNGVRLEDDYYTAPHNGAPHDYDFVMDFAADTVDMYLDDALIIAGVAMNADYSASDVQQVKARTTAYGGTDYQGIMYVDNLLISEVPEPMTMSLLALGGLALIRRRK